MKLLFSFLALVTFSLHAQVNYINYQSPVKSQYNRGTCTAFALLSALETLPGFPTDLSEQHAYALAKTKMYLNDSTNAKNEGAAYLDYVHLLDTFGITSEEKIPYNPYVGFRVEGQDNFSNLKSDISGMDLDMLVNAFNFTFALDKNSCFYAEGEDARNVNTIKKYLDDGVKNIPVSYSISEKYWSSHLGKATEKIHLDPIMEFGIKNNWYSYTAARILNSNINSDLFSGNVKYRMKNGLKDILEEGHAVSIIGYDKTGFLIKNSWGKSWGNNGYGWISFDYHKLLARRFIAITDGKIIVPNYKDKGNNCNPTDIWLKSMPSNLNENGMQLSLVYHGNSTPPDLKSIKYTIYGSCAGSAIEIANGISLYSELSLDPRTTGYSVEVLTKQILIDFISGYRIVAEMQLNNGKKITNMYYHVVPRNKEYEPNRF